MIVLLLISELPPFFVHCWVFTVGRLHTDVNMYHNKNFGNAASMFRRCFHFRFLTPINATYSEFKFMFVSSIVLCMFSIFFLCFVSTQEKIFFRLGHSRNSYIRLLIFQGTLSHFFLPTCLNVFDFLFCCFSFPH